MRILILTQPLYTNYGGLLQAYALQKVLKGMGHNVETDSNIVPLMTNKEKVVDVVKRMLKFILGQISIKEILPYYPTNSDMKIVRRNTDQFIFDYIDNVDFFKGQKYPAKDIIEKYDVFVVGSDQVWLSGRTHITNYFIDFAQAPKYKRISYAASFGPDEWVLNIKNEKILPLCKNLIQKFDAVSVREDSGVDICRNIFNVEAVHVIDPTMLLTAEEYVQLIVKKYPECVETKNENKLMTYVLDKSNEKQNIINIIARDLSLSIVDLIPVKLVSERGRKTIEECVYPPVEFWLKGFMDADFVVTDSFHGTVFSILFNKQFIAVKNEERGATRFTSLLKMFNLEDRLIDSKSSIDSHIFESKIDYAPVNKKLKEERIWALAFLKNAGL